MKNITEEVTTGRGTEWRTMVLLSLFPMKFCGRKLNSKVSSWNLTWMDTEVELKVTTPLIYHVFSGTLSKMSMNQHDGSVITAFAINNLCITKLNSKIKILGTRFLTFLTKRLH